MSVVVSILKRTLLVPGAWSVAAVAALAAWVGSDLATQSLGADQGFVEEVRHGSLLFAALLSLSLAEPLQTGHEARSGLLLLRHGKGGGFALAARWAGLFLALLPVLLLAALGAGGLPAAPWGLAGQIAVLVAGGLLLGSFLDRRRLVPALWGLAILGQLRPWMTTLEGSWSWTWLVPDLASMGAEPGGVGLGGVSLHGLLWVLGALALTHGRLLAISAR